MNKPCLDCGVPNPNSRCVQCAAVREQNKIRNRATAFERGYDKAWYKVRNKVLARDKWICYMCNKKLIGSDATVDHIIPITKDPSLRLDETNLAACCRQCNSKKQNK